MAGPGGILRAFSGLQTIKKVPKERGTRSNAGLGASGHIVFFARLSIWFSFVLRICHVTTCHDFVYTHDLSADRWLDVSLVLDGFAGCIGHDGAEFWRYIPGWDLLADIQ
jgi:hypothetical protein